MGIPLSKALQHYGHKCENCSTCNRREGCKFLRCLELSDRNHPDINGGSETDIYKEEERD